MNELTAAAPLKEENIRPYEYLHSLLKEARRAQALTQAELERIEYQLLELLSATTAQWTGGESTSVSTQRAQELLSSLRYCIGSRLRMSPTPAAALELIKTTAIAELFTQGRARVQRLLGQARQLYTMAVESRIETPLIAYNDTLLSGLPPFFKYYDPAFAADACPGSIDYPLCIEVENETGAEFMVRYIRGLLLENRFCSHFSSADIHRLMLGVHKSYQDLLVNLFEQVLFNALGCVLLGKDPHTLLLTRRESEALGKKLSSVPDEKLGPLLSAALRRLPGMETPGDSASQYGAQALKKLLPTLRAGCARGDVAGIFIPVPAPAAETAFRFEDGPCMEDDALRDFIDQLMACEYPADRITLLHGRLSEGKLSSLDDLCCILDAGCFYGEEFAAVFDVFGDELLALLYLRLPGASLEEPLLSEAQEDWQRALLHYLDALNAGRRARIRALARRIEPY